MELRKELTPPILDEAKVARLAKLADQLDGARRELSEEKLKEFNALAGTDFNFEIFQGIYGGENHADWVRRVLTYKLVRPAAEVTRDELLEIVRRIIAGGTEMEAYMAVLDANVPLANASNLLFYPPDYDVRTNTWDNGRLMGSYAPTPEQLVEWALNPHIRGGPAAE